MTRGRAALLVVCALSIVVASWDVAAAAMPQPGGESLEARVVGQIDGHIFRVDLGPSKPGTIRGIVIVRANRATRFISNAGMHAYTTYGSIDGMRIGPTVPLRITIGRHFSDGSYELLALNTIGR